MVQDKYRTCQTMCFCGVFPEIRRAWASVDNSLFLWRYDRRCVSCRVVLCCAVLCIAGGSCWHTVTIKLGPAADTPVTVCAQSTVCVCCSGHDSMCCVLCAVPRLQR